MAELPKRVPPLKSTDEPPPAWLKREAAVTPEQLRAVADLLDSLPADTVRDDVRYGRDHGYDSDRDWSLDADGEWAEVRCMTYCYGGSADIQYETVAKDFARWMRRLAKAREARRG